MKFVGVTLDPIGTGFHLHGGEVFRRVAEALPELPVLVYRRSNLVKHAAGRGGICGQDMAELHRHQSVEEFLSKVSEAVEHDKALLKAATFFPKTLTVTYEDLQPRPFDVMGGVLRFLDMPGSVTPELVQRGVQETSEDLRELFANFAELERALGARSPCLLEPLQTRVPKSFHKPCSPVSLSAR